VTHRANDSVDFVEAVMVLEEVLGIGIPDDDAERCGSPRAMVDVLERILSNQRPTKSAAELLEKIARAQNKPEIAECLDGKWRREQIAAIVRELFRSSDDEPDGDYNSGVFVRNPKRPQTDSGFAAADLDEKNTQA
jgi:hypothetical protein